MSKQKNNGIFLAVIILLVVVVFYATSVVRRNISLKATKDEAKIIKFGGEKIQVAVFRGMETARKEKDPVLVAEIKKVIDQKMMPSDIFKNNVLLQKNIASTLNKMFEGYENNLGDMQVLLDVASKSDREWGMDQATLTKCAEILNRFESKRQAIRQMLDKPDTCFYFIFHEDREFGEIVDSNASVYLLDYLTLEEYAIGQAILKGDIVEALNSLAYIFRIAQLASETGLPQVRGDAVFIRARALDIMQTIVLDPKFNKRYMNALYEMFRDQLVNWTPDSKVWTTDRASGMKAYHWIQQDGLGGALTPEEINELSERGLVNIVQKQEKGKKKSNIDDEPEIIEEKYLLNNNFLVSHVADETFYLKAMQMIINESQKPFYQRVPVLNNITNDILAKKDRPDEPVIADLLLRSTIELMRRHAQDRAGCEMAFEAMGISLEKPAITHLTSNPFSANPYDVEQILDEKNRLLVQVSTPAGRKPFQVPDYRTTK